MIFLLLLALLCAFHPSPLCEAAVCYVKPTEPHNATCPGPSEPCYTLDEYVSNSTRYFISNTVFVFLSGHHKLRHSLTVSNVHNITLKPFVESSYVVIASEQKLSVNVMLSFKSAIDLAIRGMTFKTLGITFENTSNVTLTRLRADNATIELNNVFGAVTMSHIYCEIHYYNYSCITFEWPVTQSQYIAKTVVLLNELHVSNALNGISILGCIPSTMSLMNSTFHYMRGIGVTMDLDPLCNNMTFVCKNTHFYHVSEGLNVTVQNSPPSHNLPMAISLHNVSYIQVRNVSMNLLNVHANINNCHFKGIGVSNHGITAIHSVLSLMGNVTFIGNHNHYDGGAITLRGESRILIPKPNGTYILFENNTSGREGGAIFFTSSNTYVTGYCRIFVEQDLIVSKTVLNFTNNYASKGGNAIYGAHLDSPCYSPNGSLVENLSQHILNVSSFSPSFTVNQLQPLISSDVENMCFCNEKETCLTEQEGNSTLADTSVYPGQLFELSVAVFGDMKGFVRWRVNTVIHAPDELGDTLQHYQKTNSKNCTKLQYSILSGRNKTTLYLNLDSSHIYGNHFRTINLLECPLGFSLNTKNGCDCHERLLQSTDTIHCDITEQTIQRQDTTWIGVVEKNTALAFSNVSPFHYCNRAEVKVYMKESFLSENSQCNDNRSGVLCGGCRDNYSLALGSNRCLPGCSNNSLFLIIAFAAAGIALVFFIKILNLTVSQGTINGLIFYANIVGAERTVLISSRAYMGFLSVFIAWLNLNLGIETCFFDGMDAYTKAWLQFIFPVYVWTIALFIIILSHYSIRVSKVFGNNSVPLLATLILLSYSKLLRAVISALSVTDIHFLNGSTMPVWERDGNIQYLAGKHIPLFVFAIAVLILLCFPFTLILVSIQWLQRGTHYKILRWVTKLIPFFDAFTGPLKDRHRYWVGALLLARCSLLLIFYIFTADGSVVAFVSINFCIIILSVFLAATGSVYKNYYVTVLELSYILNLGILANGTLYVQHFNNSKNQEALAMTSIGIAFLQFLATVIYHACVQLREPLKNIQFMAAILYKLGEQLKKLKVKIVQINCQKDAENANGPEYEEYEPLDGLSYAMEQPTFEEVLKFRESLLDTF